VHVTAQLSWNNLVPWKQTVGEGPDVCFKGCLLVWMQLHLSFYFLPTFWNHKLTSCSCSGLRDHATLYSIYILFEAGGQYFSLQIIFTKFKALPIELSVLSWQLLAMEELEAKILLGKNKPRISKNPSNQC